MAWARIVAVVVPSPATSEVLAATSFSICAPRFSPGALSSISLATVTPSLVRVGLPNFLAMTTFRPFGPSVTLTACAMMLIPRKSAARAVSSNRSCLCMTTSEDPEDVLFLHDEELLAVQPDLAAGILAEEDPVALFDREGQVLAVVGDLAGAHRDHPALVRLLL